MPGSISKEFVGVSIMMLVERGKMRLNDTLAQFGLGLPAWSGKVTVDHLLNYTSGIPRIDYENVKNEEDIYEDLKELPDLSFEPGTEYNYNSNSIFLQKKIIEQVTKKTFQAFVTENIITPLGLTNVVFDPDFGYPNRTRSFDADKKNASEVYSSKGWLWLSIGDMNTWITALHNHELISEESLRFLLRNQYFPNQEAMLGSANEDFTTHLHGGQSYQFEAAFISEAEEDLNIILMSNHKNQTFEIIQSVYNILLSAKHQEEEKI